MASAGFDENVDDADKRLSVQVGDPYEEKRLLVVFIELLDEGLVTGIQDLEERGSLVRQARRLREAALVWMSIYLQFTLAKKGWNPLS